MLDCTITHRLFATSTVSQQQCHNNVTTTVSQQQCHNSKFVIFQQRIIKVLKCYNFLWVQRRHSCSPAASFANCVMTLYLLQVHQQTFLSVPINKKCQILELWHSCRKWATYYTDYWTQCRCRTYKKQNSPFFVWKCTDSVVKQWHWLCTTVRHIEG